MQPFRVVGPVVKIVDFVANTSSIADLATAYNARTPMEVSLNGVKQFVYLSVSVDRSSAGVST